MNFDTDSAFIVTEEFTMFIDGIPDTCDHDNKEQVLYTASGKTIYWYTFLQWAHYTYQMRNSLIYPYQESIDDPIVGGACACSKCGKAFSPPMF